VATFQKRGVAETMSNEEIKIKYLEAENKSLFVTMQAEVLKCEAVIKALEAELKVTFDNMMRYMMFIRDNGYTTEYMKYAKEKGYE
jgi:hypothetical protein